MKYSVTCLSPSLVGDGQKLAPIDYMVWKEHVNVLSQRRIFRLLARGPRLDGYLAQLKKADRLDFASWGGFAQNFAGRRIPFEHASSIPVWERAPAQNLFIPTFACSPSGPYLPATAIKGALRTGSVFDRWSENTMRDIAARIETARMEDARPPRNPAVQAENAVLGGSGSNRMRRIAAADSAPITHAAMKVYLLRTSTLVARGAGRYELGWKSPRGTSEAKRIDESTPVFAEMCPPGTAFEGVWREKSLGDRQKMFAASNRYAASQLARHKQYAEWCGLDHLAVNLAAIETRLAAATDQPGTCLLALGWGAGMLSKIAAPDSDDSSFRSILQHVPLYQKALQTGLPFPKTRRIVFEGGHPAHLPGWVLLEVA
jgi:CRISPR-associated protein Csm5